MKDEPTTNWYYEFYETGTFPTQRELCRALEWTECNLEGQRVVPTVFFKKLPDGTEKKTPTTKLTGERANPLTIRLFGVRNKLGQLERIVNEVKSKIKEQEKAQFSAGRPFGIKGTYITSSSTSVETGGAPVERLEISDVKETIEFRHIEVHSLLYELFISFGSILDRLAYEINLLYNLDIQKVDWPKLIGSPDKAKNLDLLGGKDERLANFVSRAAPKFEKALSYRNRLVHDGIIRIDTDISLQGLSVILAEDPNNNRSPMNVNAIDFCKRAKVGILELLNESYRLMLEYHKGHGNPPW